MPVCSLSTCCVPGPHFPGIYCQMGQMGFFKVDRRLRAVKEPSRLQKSRGWHCPTGLWVGQSREAVLGEGVLSLEAVGGGLSCSLGELGALGLYTVAFSTH